MPNAGGNHSRIINHRRQGKCGELRGSRGVRRHLLHECNSSSPRNPGIAGYSDFFALLGIAAAAAPGTLVCVAIIHLPLLFLIVTTQEP